MAESMTFCTDCMKYMRNVPTGYFDLAIVDPPYGIGDTWKKIILVPKVWQDVPRPICLQ